MLPLKSLRCWGANPGSSCFFIYLLSLYPWTTAALGDFFSACFWIKQENNRLIYFFLVLVKNMLKWNHGKPLWLSGKVREDWWKNKKIPGSLPSPSKLLKNRPTSVCGKGKIGICVRGKVSVLKMSCSSSVLKWPVTELKHAAWTLMLWNFLHS